MSKITFRADDGLVERLEEFDASKSEVMRDALREYLDESVPRTAREGMLDDLVAERVDALVAERLSRSPEQRKPRKIDVRLALEGGSLSVSPGGPTERKTTRPEPDPDASPGAEGGPPTCTQCGDELGRSPVYCPNCGEKAAHRIFCECGDELRSDWSFCPGCGRRTPSADVLENP